VISFFHRSVPARVAFDPRGVRIPCWCTPDYRAYQYPASTVGVRGRRRYRREAATPVEEFLDSWRSGSRESSHHGDVKVVFPSPPLPLSCPPTPSALCRLSARDWITMLDTATRRR